MSTLAMILTAAMVVPGDGPKMESREIEQGLDLSGTWEGTFHAIDGEVWTIHLTRARCRCESKRAMSEYDNPFRDDGGGKLHIHNRPGRLGIYRQEGDHLIICLGDEYRPTTFRTTDGQNLLILHRVKPSK
jgi:hypothetical protein